MWKRRRCWIRRACRVDLGLGLGLVSTTRTPLWGLLWIGLAVAEA